MKRRSRLKEEVINGRAKKEPKGYEKKGTPSSERLSSGSRIIREDPRRTKTPKKKGSLRSEPEADLWKVSFWTRTPLRIQEPEVNGALKPLEVPKEYSNENIRGEISRKSEGV